MLFLLKILILSQKNAFLNFSEILQNNFKSLKLFLSIFERKNLTGTSRLLLHAQNLEFEFLEENFKFESKANFEKEILNTVKN